MRSTKHRSRPFGEIGTEESSLTTVGDKIARAAVLAERASTEAEAARAAPDIDYARLQQAAQKGWTAASLAVDALVLRRTGRRPRGTNRRLEEMSDLASSDRQIAPLDRDFGSFLGYLHVTCGHEGTCSAKLVPRRLSDVQKFVEAMAKLCGRR